MVSNYLKEAIERIPALEESGLTVSRAIHRAVLQGGDPVRSLTDLLHGTWLGHPLHAVLTDATVGAWTFGGLFDALAAASGSHASERMADTLTAAGTASAVPTALAGVADFSTAQKPAMNTATWHALLNGINVLLYLLSIRDRRNGRRTRGVCLSTTALALATLSAWLGGHLVYGHKVGVDHSEARSGPEAWMPVLEATALAEEAPQRVDVDGSPVLLHRCDGTVHAIGAVCSHAGGPLDQGRFEACTVQCPWHDSVFDLRDGRIVHGPAVHPQPAYEARERNGQVEVRQPRS